MSRSVGLGRHLSTRQQTRRSHGRSRRASAFVRPLPGTQPSGAAAVGWRPSLLGAWHGIEGAGEGSRPTPDESGHGVSPSGGRVSLHPVPPGRSGRGHRSVVAAGLAARHAHLCRYHALYPVPPRPPRSVTAASRTTPRTSLHRWTHDRATPPCLGWIMEDEGISVVAGAGFPRRSARRACRDGCVRRATASCGYRDRS